MILRSRHKIIGIVVFSFISVLAFFLSPGLLEKVYGGLLFPLVRLFFSLLVWIPVPLIYLILVSLLILIISLLRGQGSLKSKGFKSGALVLSVILLFYWLWAYNYKRVSFGDRFPVSLPPVDSQSLKEELAFAAQLLLDNSPSHRRYPSLRETERIIRPQVDSVCRKFGYQTPGTIRVKALYPKGLLLRIRTAGFYFPHGGEAYIDPGLHELQIPFTMAHEMGHGFGVADEGACNFIALMALHRHPDSMMRYSGAMGYFRYVAGAYRYYFPEDYQHFRDQLPAAIQDDLNQINARLLKYPDIFPKLRDRIYDNYLKMQGIHEGLGSYDKIIDMVREARQRGIW